MKNHFFCALGCAAALLAAGCASTSAEQSSQAQVSVKAIQSEDVAGVVISGKNVGDTILTALQKNDFSMVQKLPIGDGKNTFTQKKFNALYAKVKEQGGIELYQSSLCGAMICPPIFKFYKSIFHISQVLCTPYRFLPPF